MGNHQGTLEMLLKPWGGADYSTLKRVQSQKRNRIHRTRVNKAKLDGSTSSVFEK